MPMYEFECSACKHRFDELVRTADAIGDVRCPACGARKVTRQPSVFAAHAAAAPSLPSGCGRCGDPQGPCAMRD